MGERGRSQGHGHGHGKGTGAGSAGQCASDRERDPRHGQGDRGVEAGKGPKGKGKGAAGPRGQTGWGMGAMGGGWREGRGMGGGAPPQRDVQPVRCIPGGIQQMPAHHTHHHHHHPLHLHNINPDAGDLIPPNPHGPSTSQPAPRRGRSRRGRLLPRRGGGRGAALAPQAQGPQGEPEQGAGGAQPWDLDWGMVPDPLGNEPHPLVVEPYGWLSWASSWTTREMRNRPFGAVLLRRDRGNQGVPRGGVDGTGGPREGPPGGDLGGVARQRADVAGLPGGGGGAPHHGCGSQQLAPPGLPQRPRPLALPPAEPATATAPTPTQAATQVTATPRRPRRRARESGRGTVPRGAPAGGAGPPNPHPHPRYSAMGGRGRQGGGNKCEGRPIAPQPNNC